MLPEHPSADDRSWLTDELTQLIARAGWERFALAPLIRATESFFPDRYVHGPAGVRTVGLRMLRHAELDEFRMRVVDRRVAESQRPDVLLDRTDIQFGGLAENVLAIELVALGAPADVVPGLAHSVARAFRVHTDRVLRSRGGPYRAEVSDDVLDDEMLEAQRATVASVYLGFGIIAANGAHRYRAAGQQTAGWTRTEWVHDSVGGLDPSAVSYLLALQLAVREVNEAYATHVVADLAPNQASDVRAWMNALRPEAAALRARLGIETPPSAWDPEWPPALEALSADDDDDESAAIVRPEALRLSDTRKPNAGRTVWRVRRTRIGQLAMSGAMLGIVPIALLANVNLWLGALLWLACVVVGAVAGRRLRNDFCSDRDCEQALDRRHLICPRCGGTVAGEIKHQSDRLAAEEALEEKHEQALEPPDDGDA